MVIRRFIKCIKLTSHYLYEENSLADVIMVDHYDNFPVHVVEYLIYSCDFVFTTSKTLFLIYMKLVYIIRRVDRL